MAGEAHGRSIATGIGDAVTAKPPMGVAAKSGVSASAVRLAARRRRVAQLLSRGYSSGEIAEIMEVSDETIRRDIHHLRAAFARDMGESSSVMNVAEGVIRRAKEREKELWRLIDETKPRYEVDEETGKRVRIESEVQHPHLIRLQAARELRANADHEVKILQSLGLVYKEPEQVTLAVRMMSQLMALPEDMLDRLANANDDGTFRRLLRGIVGDADAARVGIATPGADGVEGEDGDDGLEPISDADRARAVR